jgi:iron complex transport system ATP-binding protein
MILEIKQASFSYHSKASYIFENINFAVDRGEVLCILGPNGVGKTTLLKCITGLLSLTGGRIFLNGLNIKELKRRDLAQKMAYVPQIHQSVFSFTVFDTVLMGRTPHLGFFSLPSRKDHEITSRTISSLGIVDLAAKSFAEISGGERQLVLFARALAQQAGLIVLDEPTTHLDYGNQVKILNLIHELAGQGFTVMMTSHNPDHAFMISDKVVIMNQGQLKGFGPPDRVITEESLRDLYGIKVKIIDSVQDGKFCIPLMPESSRGIGDVRSDP